MVVWSFFLTFHILYFSVKKGCYTSIVNVWQDFFFFFEKKNIMRDKVNNFTKLQHNDFV